MKRFLPPLLPLLVVVVSLEFLVRWQILPSFLVPAPSEVARSLVVDRAEYWTAVTLTGGAAALGLLLSFVIGTSLAIVLSTSVFLRRAFFPYAVFFQTVPIIAIAPVLVVWFGYGLPTVIASAFIVSLFPVVASTLLGLQSTDPALLDLFRLYRASRLHSLLRLRLPFALPQIYSGLRVASGLAVIGAIVGEFIAGGGLGGVVDSARTLQRIDKVFAAVLISSILGLLFVVVINAFSRFSLRHWHASERTVS
ncbi:MAG: ABC transporter permease subunit [Bdellovibrionaceae bacterium]|nr:ABC transporter permease subunit [Pseudobdellovibrionaceae bacterium]